MVSDAAFRMRVATGEVAVNVSAMDDLVEEIRGRLAVGRGFAVGTVNLDHLVKLREGAAFRAAYGALDFVVADGNPVVWLSRLAGRPVELVPGSDLVAPLARLAAAADAPVALVGSTPQALAGAALRLSEAAPGVRIAAMISPSQGFDPEGDEAAGVFQQLSRSGARLTILALGAPKQEIFAARGRAALPDMGFACLGAGLDFIAGAQRRAPRWMRRLALEWLWRAAREPGRLGGRYARCALILPGLLWGALTTRQPPPRSGAAA